MRAAAVNHNPVDVFIDQAASKQTQTDVAKAALLI